MGRRIQEEVGSGISRRVRASELFDPNNPVDAAKIVDWFEEGEAKRTRPWGDHAEVIEAVRAELARLRKPMSDLEHGTTAYLEAMKQLNSLFKERHSEAWYLLEISQFATIVEIALAGGREWEAITRAIQMGELLSELRLKFEWDTDATFGRQQRTNLSQGQANRRRSSKEQRHNDIEGLLAKGLTLSRACQLLCKQHHVRPETLEKDYQRTRKERTSARMRLRPIDT